MDFFFPGSEDENPTHLEILNDLSKQWLLNEVNHRVSKEASNKFWEISNRMFHQLYLAKENQGRKIPQFPQLRTKLYENEVPDIKLSIGYECKETGEITVVEDVSSTPVSKFPPATYRKLYETAYVSVSHFY